MLILQRARAFDGDTGIGMRRPNTGGDELGGRRGFGEGGGNRREGEQQSGSLADDLSSCQFEFNHASKTFFVRWRCVRYGAGPALRGVIQGYGDVCGRCERAALLRTIR